MLFGCSHVQRAPKKMNALLQEKLFIKGIITMMNKNFALIALVLGFSVVANVSAADRNELETGVEFLATEGQFDGGNEATDVATATCLDWAKANKPLAIGGTVVTAAVVGLVVDAIVRGKKCSVAQAYSYLFGKKATLAAELVVTEAVSAEVAAN